MTTKCIYHSADLDGHCSGALVKARYPDAEMIGMDYGDEMTLEVDGDTDLVIVDFSLPMAQMIELEKRVKALTWIDHHHTAMTEAADAGFNPSGKREVGKAACELAWEYYFPGELTPPTVHLLGRYDVWDHSDPDTIPFQVGFQIQDDTLPGSDIWAGFFGCEKPTNDVVADGIKILKFRSNSCLKSAVGIDTVFENMDAVAVNHGPGGSWIFEHVYAPGTHQLMIRFHADGGGTWSVSLYSEDKTVDCGTLAKRYGGGGHRGAAGFRCRELPFTI